MFHVSPARLLSLAGKVVASRRQLQLIRTAPTEALTGSQRWYMVASIPTLQRSSATTPFPDSNVRQCSDSCAHTHGQAGREGEADDENEGVTIFRPDDGLTAEQKERKRMTDAFLDEILTTADEQEWRDMLSAALRHGTWREHHLQAVLRGVGLLKYDAAQPVQDSSSAGRRGTRPPPRSTPTQRLERAKNVVIFLTEEAKVISSLSSDAGIGSACYSNGVYKPSEASVHKLLTQLLRGAQHYHNPSAAAAAAAKVDSRASSPANTGDALPHALYKDVWSFLAWMELHDYHVRSADLLAELESTVDLDEDCQETGGASSSSSSSLVPTPKTQQPSVRYVVMSRRVNRLEFIRREREWLQRTEHDSTAKASRRHPDMPRAVPEL